MHHKASSNILICLNVLVLKNHHRCDAERPREQVRNISRNAIDILFTITISTFVDTLPLSNLDILDQMVCCIERREFDLRNQSHHFDRRY